MINEYITNLLYVAFLQKKRNTCQQGLLTESSNAERNKGWKALITGQLHQRSILCLAQVQQLETREKQHTSQRQIKW